MFIPLPQDRFELVRPLFSELSYHLIIEAVLVGNSPAIIFVDNLENPKTAFMHSPEGDFWAGASDNPAFNQGMQAWIDEHMLHGEEDEFVVSFEPDNWQQALKEILVERPPVAYERYYYELTEAKFDNPHPLDPEFKLQIVTEEFITQEHIKNMQIIHDGIKSNWASRELFFEKGFGLCVLHEDEIISWSVVDCVVDNRCEIGIFTNPRFRRRGVATALISAVIDYALSHGFKQIGWHCWVDNWGSIGVADKVGLIQKRRYMAYISLQTELFHFGLTGLRRLEAKDYENAEKAYLIALKDESSVSQPYFGRAFYEMARVQAGLGREEAAFDYLDNAIKNGWKNLEVAQNALEFAQLQTNPLWKSLFS